MSNNEAPWIEGVRNPKIITFDDLTEAEQLSVLQDCVNRVYYHVIEADIEHRREILREFAGGPSAAETVGEWMFAREKYMNLGHSLLERKEDWDSRMIEAHEQQFADNNKAINSLNMRIERKLAPFIMELGLMEVMDNRYLVCQCGNTNCPAKRHVFVLREVDEVGISGQTKVILPYHSRFGGTLKEPTKGAGFDPEQSVATATLESLRHPNGTVH